MHRPRSPRIVSAMKVGAWFFLLACLAITVATGFLGYSFTQGHKHYLLPSLGGIFGGLLLLLIYRIRSSSARCPLCTGPVLLSQRCSRHRKAGRLFGSYRLRVARDIAFFGAFKCPYCGEDTVCLPRTRGPQT